MKNILILLFLFLNLSIKSQTIIIDNKELLSDNVKEYIKNNMKNLEEETLIYSCDVLTRRLLKFSFTNKNPNLKDVCIGKELSANCVGYAKLYKAITEYAFKVKGVKVKVIHYRGPFKMKKTDITKNVSYILSFVSKKASNFTKDHDYCLVILKNKKYKIDSSINEITLGIL